MARKKKIELSDSMTLEYQTINDLMIIKNGFQEGLKMERKNGHVQLYSIYENVIRALDKKILEDVLNE